MERVFDMTIGWSVRHCLALFEKRSVVVSGDSRLHILIPAGAGNTLAKH